MPSNFQQCSSKSPAKPLTLSWRNIFKVLTLGAFPSTIVLGGGEGIPECSHGAVELLPVVFYPWISLHRPLRSGIPRELPSHNYKCCRTLLQKVTRSLRFVSGNSHSMTHTSGCFLSLVLVVQGHRPCLLTPLPMSELFFQPGMFLQG